MKISVLTLGCKVNHTESSMMEERLQAEGHNIIEISEQPDICIINTCSVTAKSDYQSRQLIRRAYRAGAKVIVTGCYSELNRDAVRSMPGVAVLVQNCNKAHIIKEITGKDSERTLFCYDTNRKKRYFLKVQDGCNYSCSYCIIPQARGRSRSMTIEWVTTQVRKVSSQYREVVLSGIHLGTYGYDLIPRVNLSELIEALVQTPIKRIRLSSLEIAEINDELLDRLVDDKICRHLHIPLQSGDDGILKRMNRNYDSRLFSSVIEQIYNKFPDINIGTDVIVGFPGEGEREFDNTRKLLDSFPFAYFHVFPFSPRPGTMAATMPEQIDPRIKKKRSSLLLELGRRKKHAFMERQVGKTLDALIEESGDNGSCIGTTGNYLKVETQLDRAVLGETVNVRIARHDGERLIGVPIYGS
ncbi:MAG: tRNA (N(6)-L-threonylcarbamoyladenosine(37)-C(2))-methylthiotransferase MtaB [Thermodesulfovibrionales bacterium]|jgi:threonylcarbamoyladenosine tRNA methylthiotransferase MtaB